MLRGIYDAGAAVQASALNQELVAENLAHATTPGYRRQGMTFEALLAAGQPSPNPTPQNSPQGNGVFTTFDAGPIQQTGNPLDLAISGEAFFTLEGPNGPVYTRNGVFEINAQGELQNRGGLKLRGQGGPITLPPEVGTIHVAVDGTVFANGTEVGRLQLAQFDNPAELRRVGTTLFEGPAPRVPELGSVRVEQGYREGSNVSMVQEMIAMMIGLRQYEAAERAMRALGEAVALNTRPQG
jgi:flagellar basal-body rod protein FlgF